MSTPVPPIPSVDPLDLTQERVAVGDTVAFVEKINRMQAKQEAMAAQINAMAQAIAPHMAAIKSNIEENNQVTATTVEQSAARFTKATQEEAAAGVDDEHYMTPVKTQKALYSSIPIIVGGDGNTFYPVFISFEGGNGGSSRAGFLSVFRGYDDAAPGNVWNSADPSRPGGLSFSLLSNFDYINGGNGTGNEYWVTYLSQTYTNILGGFDRIGDYGCVVWLRGGQAKYFIKSELKVETVNVALSANSVQGVQYSPRNVSEANAGLEASVLSRYPFDDGLIDYRKLANKPSMFSGDFYDLTSNPLDPIAIQNANGVRVNDIFPATYSLSSGTPETFGQIITQGEKYRYGHEDDVFTGMSLGGGATYKVIGFYRTDPKKLILRRIT